MVSTPEDCITSAPSAKIVERGWPTTEVGLRGVTTPPAMTDLTPERIRAALTLHNGNVSAAARALGVTRVTLYKWMKRWGISVDRTIKEEGAA